MAVLKVISKGETYDFVYDDEDEEIVKAHHWTLSRFRNGKLRAEFKDKNKSIRLHRLIMGVTDPNVKVDHIDGDTQNNRRSNLRLASNAENLRNRGKTSGNTSGYKGVTWNKRSQKWIAQIKIDYKSIVIGRFDDKEKAAEAYIEAAKIYHKEFAQN